MVQRMEVVAAQVFTARDAMRAGNEADLRIALVLLDSAIETLMVRRIDYILTSFEVHGDEVPGWREAVDIDLDDTAQLARYPDSFRVAWRMSKSLGRSIDREFGSKLKFLAWNGVIPATYVKPVSRLHDYRNEVVHQDATRPKSLLLTVHLAAWFAAEFVRLIRPLALEITSAEEGVRRIYERAGVEVDPAMFSNLLWTLDLDLPNFISTQLMDGLDAGLSNAASLLAEVARDRLRSTEYDLRLIGSWHFEDLPHTELDLVRIVYNTDQDNVPAPQLPVSLERLRRLPSPITRAMLNEWRSWPDRIARAENPLDAFDLVADFEASYERFESKVSEYAAAVDVEQTLQYDLWRGR